VAAEKTKVEGSRLREALSFARRIIETCGPRPAGSISCHESAVMLKDELEKHCDRAALETFTCHPAALYSFLKVLVLSYITASAMLIPGGTWVWASVVVYCFGLLYAVRQFCLFRQTFDGFFKSAIGYNVAGVIEPAREAKRQVIIAGHHDSGPIFTYLLRHQKLYAFRFFGGVAAYITALVLSCSWAVTDSVSGWACSCLRLTPYAAIVLGVFVVPLYFAVKKESSPGAGDNLISSVMAVKLAEIFAARKKDGKSALESTRLILISFDAEEAGFRGSRAYARRHRDELRSLPTFMLNMECIYRTKELSFVVVDGNGLIRLSRSLADECRRIARSLGYESRLVSVPCGGGGTDAAEFAKIGVEATTLLAMSSRLVRDGLVYHTPADTVDNLEPAAVGAALDIALAFIVQKDAGAPPRAPSNLP
jgi:aminopeptidase YwaD